VIELDEHQPRCACGMCAAKRWLRYVPEEDRYPVGVSLKIARYGGTGSGSHEPDALFDAVVTEADFRRALALIPSEWLRKVGQTWMATPPPPVTHRKWQRRPGDGRGCTCAMFGGKRSECAGVILDPDGPQSRREAVMGKLNIDQEALSRLIDDCCREMALVMGERVEGRPSRRAPAKPVPYREEPDPVRYKHYPALVP